MFCSYYRHNVVYSKDQWLFKTLTDDEVKDFVVINFGKSFKSKKMCSKLSEKGNLRKVVKLLCIFIATPDEVGKYGETSSSDKCVCPYNVKILNLFYPPLQLINIKQRQIKRIIKRFEKV